MKTAEQKKKILTDVKKFTITRSKWARGGMDSSTKTALLNSRNGKMCCLGFYALACGLKEEDIKNIGEPQFLQNFINGEQTENIYGTITTGKNKNTQWKTKLLKVEGGSSRNTAIAHRLMQTNDERLAKTDESKREEKVKKLFKQIGVQVEFKN